MPEEEVRQSIVGAEHPVIVSGKRSLDGNPIIHHDHCHKSHQPIALPRAYGVMRWIFGEFA
jgi:hypothetical protein